MMLLVFMGLLQEPVASCGRAPGLSMALGMDAGTLQTAWCMILAVSGKLPPNTALMTLSWWLCLNYPQDVGRAISALRPQADGRPLLLQEEHEKKDHNKRTYQSAARVSALLRSWC